MKSGDVAFECRVTDKLHEGGISQIFAATDLTDGAEVALKVLSTMPPDYWRAFDAGTIAAAAVGHPGLIAVRRTVATPEGGAVVMERLRGASVDDIQRGRGGPTVAPVELLVQAADALAAVHRRGLWHGALEPQHLFAASDGDGAAVRLKLLDFGGGALVPLEYKSTRTGFMGNARCTSPERIQQQALTAASDVYSLGCIFYQLFSGRPPFDGDAAMQIFVAHLRETAPPLVGFSPSLAALLAAMLDKRPAARPSSAEIAVALD